MSSRYLQHRPSRSLPKHIKNLIKLRGGVNKFDEPRYRLVWGPDRFEQVGGEWFDWDESLAVNDRNYVNRKGEALNKPKRVVIELRWIQKYPIQDKWILEKWVPSDFYGNPEDWFKAVAPDGKTPLLGGFPYDGDYEDTGYAFPNEAITEGILGNAIGRIEHYVDNLPSTLIGRMKRSEYLAKQKDDAKELVLDKRNTAIVQDAGWAFNGKSFSSGTGVKHQSDREATATRLGLNLNNI